MTTPKSSPQSQPMPSIHWQAGTLYWHCSDTTFKKMYKAHLNHNNNNNKNHKFFGLLNFRPSPALRPVTGEETRDSEEESEYMIPSSRPVLPPTPPTGELPQVPRPPQPQPVSALQTQTQVSTVGSRYLKHSVNLQPAAHLYEITLVIAVLCLLSFCCCRLTLAELEDGPQMYEAMYNVQSRSQQARDSGITNLSSHCDQVDSDNLQMHESVWRISF